MIAAIEPNLTRPGALRVTTDLCARLRELGVDYLFYSSNDFLAKDLGGKAVPQAEFYGCPDVVIAVGGDGSIIRTAKYASAYEKPVLGINAGNVAFMAGLEANEMSLLSNLTTGDYSVDPRMMLTVSVFQDGKTLIQKDCLNDAVFARGEGIYLTEITVTCDDVPVNTYRCDGLVLATPTGSTAYSFAAGGPVAEPTLESILMTPISPYAIFSRSVIFSAGSVLRISSAKRNRPLFLSADGGEAVEIPFGAFAIVRKCERYANFIRIKNDRFWNVLLNKIGN